MDLEAYFERVGYRGERAPTLATLSALSDAHVRAVPFENIDVLLEHRISLTPEALFAKLVVARRGGYCFEQNGLFLEVLQALGFQVVPLSARVRLGRQRHETPARTHVLLRVDLGAEGVWLADVGVGAASLTSPIRFDPSGAEQETRHEPRRITAEDGRFFHQVKHGTEWSDVYELTGEEMPFIDRVVGNWYTSASPESHFKDRLIVARALPDGRRMHVENHDFVVRNAKTGEAQKRRLESAHELLGILDSEFGLGGLAEAHGAKLFAAGVPT